jgi:uncharacterized membrane protein YdjX (TVP38/TMEM64 family)
MEARGYKKNHPRMRRALTRLLALFLIASLVLLIWRWSPLVERVGPEEIGNLLDRVSDHAYSGPLVVAIYLLGSLIFFPVTALIAATGVAFGPWEGLIWASIATLVAAIVYYYLARLLPPGLVDRRFGRWTRRMGSRFQRDGIVAIMIARNVPFAPFQLVNVVAGLANIRFSDYLIGTILGMGPTLLALTILGDRLRGAWDAPTLENVALLLLAIALWFAVALGLQAVSNRWVALRGRRPVPPGAVQSVTAASGSSLVGAIEAAGNSGLFGAGGEAAGDQGACQGQQDGNPLQPG